MGGVLENGEQIVGFAADNGRVVHQLLDKLWKIFRTGSVEQEFLDVIPVVEGSEEGFDIVS